MRKSLWLITFLLLVVALSVGAQDENNLLTNPGFEQPYTDLSADPSRQRQVAEGWTPWDITAVEIQPEYAPASAARPERVLSDEESQTYIAYFAAPVGGLFQTVANLPVGQSYTFGVTAYVWSSQDDMNAEESIDPGGVTVDVGIDPTGGVDPESDLIVWSEPVEIYDEPVQLLVSAQTDNGIVTVFTRVAIEQEVLITEVYFDDASLTVGDFAPESTAAATEPAAEATSGVVEVPVITEEVQPTVETQPTEDNSIALTADAALTLDAVSTGNAVIFGTATAIIAQATETSAALQQQQTQAVVDAFNITATALIAEVTGTAVALTNVALSQPTAAPTDLPTEIPTDVPTEIPTDVPTDVPTDIPAVVTDAPTVPPTEVPATEVSTEVSAEATEAVEAVMPVSEQFPGRVLHTVQPYDTVADLAVLYDSTIAAIIEANGLDENALIYVGQGLVIPVRILPVTATPTATPIVIVVTATAVEEGTGGSQPTVEGNVYIVRRGDTLTTIARQFNTTVRTLAELNGIVNVNSIQAGQRLMVPVGDNVPTPEAPSEPTPVPTEEVIKTYRVQPGDSLYNIAIREGVTVSSLAELNNISNPNLIYVGQVLQLP